MVHAEGKNDRVEAWKDYKNYYQVSNFGRIFSKRYNKIMKPTLSVYGYYRVCIYDSPKHYKNELVHRIVAQVFIPNPDNLPEVNHKDECKTNNNVNNLEWCTNYYNQNYGSHQANCAKAHLNHPSYSKPVDVYDLDMNFIETLPSSKECGRKYKVQHSNVRYCCNGGKWSDKTHTTWWKVNRVGNYIFRWHK